MEKQPQRRIIFTADARFALTKPEAGKPAVLTGYALVWNVLSTDRGGYKVRLAPQSAKFASPTHALFHHDYRLVLGNTENNTLTVTPDDFGVKIAIALPDTTAGRDTYELVDKKYIRGMSFAMVDVPEGESVTENGQTIFDAKSFTVDEVTVTAIPSFTQTSIGVSDPGDAGFSLRREQSLNLQRLKLEMLQLGAD